MDNEIQAFNFEGNATRVVLRNGEPWWIASDICAILGHSNPTVALERLDDDERSKLNLGRAGATNIVNEPGLYGLILGSRKPEARAFKRWIKHEVLPAINRHGVYMTPQRIEEVLTDPDTIIKIAQALKDEHAKRLELEAQAEQDRPKVLFADSVECSKDGIYVNELAKFLRQNGIDIGEKRLFAWLRENGWLMRYGNKGNIPTQKAMNASLFTVRETEKTTPDGTVRLFRTPLVTGRGQRYFINHFLNEKAYEEADRAY